MKPPWLYVPIRTVTLCRLLVAVASPSIRPPAFQCIRYLLSPPVVRAPRALALDPSGALCETPDTRGGPRHRHTPSRPEPACVPPKGDPRRKRGLAGRLAETLHRGGFASCTGRQSSHLPGRDRAARRRTANGRRRQGRSAILSFSRPSTRRGSIDGGSHRTPAESRRDAGRVGARRRHPFPLVRRDGVVAAGHGTARLHRGGRRNSHAPRPRSPGAFGSAAPYQPALLVVGATPGPADGLRGRTASRGFRRLAALARRRRARPPTVRPPPRETLRDPRARLSRVRPNQRRMGVRLCLDAEVAELRSTFSRRFPGLAPL